MKLFWKIASILVVAEIAVITADVLIAGSLLMDETEQSIETQRRFQEDLLVQVLAPAIITADFASIEETLNNVGANPWIAHVAVTDRGGHTISGESSELPWLQATGTTHQDMVGQLELDHDRRDIVIAGEIVGTIEIFWSNRDLAKIRENLQTSSLEASLIGILLAAACGLLLSSSIIERIRPLRDALRGFADGEEGIRVQVRGKDELAELCTGFNRMAETTERQTMRYRAIVESMPGVVLRMEVNQKGEPVRTIHVSRQAIELYGIEDHQIPELQDWRRFIAPEYHAPLLEWWQRTVANDSPAPLEYKIRRPDGSERWAVISARVFKETDGKLIRQALIFDISDRKRMELELEDAYHGLERKVAKRTAALKEANGNLEATIEELKQTQAALVESEKMAALGSLVAGVAHEINTPIGISLTASTNLADRSRDTMRAYEEQVLRRSDMEDHFSLLQETCRIVQSNLDRASTLIRNFKQVAVDQTHSEAREVDVMAYVEEVMGSLGPVLRRAGCSLRMNGPAGEWATLQTGPLAQILTNLTTNAIQHAFDGGGVKDAELCVDVAIQNDRLCLTMADNGIWMEAEVREHLFDPFFTTKRNSGGTGLGMHIVFNLVTQAFKGWITCDSKPGQGSTFVIEFPISRISTESKGTRTTLIPSAGSAQPSTPDK